MNPLEHYQSLKKNNSSIINDLKQKVNLWVVFRIASFLLIPLLIYLFFGKVSIIVPCILGSVGLFLFSIKRHGEASKKMEFHISLEKIYSYEIDVLAGKFSADRKGENLRTKGHAFSNDLDIFGEKSLYQYIDRTESLEGAKKLASYLESNEPSEIENKQDWYKELAEKETFRHYFLATLMSCKSNISIEDFSNWMKNHKPMMNPFKKVLIIIFPFIGLGALTAYTLGFISGFIFTAIFIFGLGLIGSDIKNITRFYNHINQIGNHISVYEKLILSIEKESFESEIGNRIQEAMKIKDDKADVSLASLNNLIDLFNNRNNFIIGIIGNALLLFDWQCVHRLEKWINNYGADSAKWFEIAYQMEADICLANLVFNRSDLKFPEITNSEVIVQAEGIGHPMIDKKKCVKNDVKIDSNSFFIVTGANMAGKSTFLRTTGVAIVMANIGLPVCADQMTYSPIKLISSMRTEDSLKDDASFFFAELSRLKNIIDHLKTDRYLVILDEILKGTNSKDKEEGSIQFVKKLVSLKAAGLIATHDLGLCKITETLPEVRNKYFDANIDNDELTFDYKMRDGICTNMNASFLMRKMDIV